MFVSPRPINERLASIRMAADMLAVVLTMSGYIPFGTTWRSSMRHFPSPIVSAAETKARLRSETVWARISRALAVHRRQPDDDHDVVMLPPKSAITIRIRKKTGVISKTLMTNESS